MPAHTAAPTANRRGSDEDMARPSQANALLVPHYMALIPRVGVGVGAGLAHFIFMLFIVVFLTAFRHAFPTAMSSIAVPAIDTFKFRTG